MSQSDDVLAKAGITDWGVSWDHARQDIIWVRLLSIHENPDENVIVNGAKTNRRRFLSELGHAAFPDLAANNQQTFLFVLREIVEAALLPVNRDQSKQLINALPGVRVDDKQQARLVFPASPEERDCTCFALNCFYEELSKRSRNELSCVEFGWFDCPKFEEAFKYFASKQWDDLHSEQVRSQVPPDQIGAFNLLCLIESLRNEAFGRFNPRLQEEATSIEMLLKDWAAINSPDQVDHGAIRSASSAIEMHCEKEASGTNIPVYASCLQALPAFRIPEKHADLEGQVRSLSALDFIVWTKEFQRRRAGV